LTIYPV